MQYLATIIDNVAYLSILVVSVLYVVLMLKRDVQMLQQNSYFNDRYLRWFRSSDQMLEIYRLSSLVVFAALLANLFYTTQAVVWILTAGMLWVSYKLMVQKYKKPLVFTKRVWRIYLLSIGIALLLVGLAIVFGNMRWGISVALLMGFCSWLITMLTNTLLQPVERSINRGFINAAKAKLSSVSGIKVIGITGSYGKTSTKHYLNRILSEKYSVLMTPGSFNTPLGVTRTINEQLQPYHEVFICEMGAKQVGDIREVCEIAHPQMGIITAVGPQHLETFHSIENVQRTKFELADALPADGLVVLNNDFEYIANRQVNNVETVRYGITNTTDCQYMAHSITYTNRGTRFSVRCESGDLEFETKLLGECNVSNLIAAIIIALRMEVPIEKIRYAVSRIEQVEHRLSLKRTATGITIIDDAYNSNPSGSRMAMEVLSHFTGGQRIVITPGMIELGDKQYKLNADLGEYIGRSADVAIIVGQYNRDALLEGIHRTDFDSSKLYVVDNFAVAQQTMLGLAKPGDTVLYENDLPDTFK